MKVFISIKNEYIVFSKNEFNSYSEFIDNYVNNIKKIELTEEFIKNNFDNIVQKINTLIYENKISKAKIANLEISEIVLKLLNKIKNIKYILFEEDKELNYTLSFLLLENTNLKEINCYDLPNTMFEKFINCKVITRCQILFISDLMNYNNIDTYSKLCNIEKIKIDKLEKYDTSELNYLFEANKKLKVIEIYKYDYKKLIDLLEQIKKNNKNNLKIVIYEENETVKNLLKDSNKFNNLNKKYNVDLKIKYSKEYKKKNKLKEINIVMCKTVILIMFFSACSFIGINKYFESKAITDIEIIKQEVSDIVNEVEETIIYEVEETIIDEQEVVNSIKTASPYYTKYENIYSKLLEKNSDTIGWIKVNNTKIDYPVVQSSDNNYYLNHSFTRAKNGAGWIFADYRNNIDTLDKNTIIYGHNVSKNELMFGSLKNTLNETWYSNNDNLIITLNIKGKDTKWQIFSIYTIETTSDYLKTKFASDTSFLEFINMIKNRSIANFNVEINADDKILTLSTCYIDSSHRLVVHAKKI